MSDRVFLDTNILVYAFDADEPEKQKCAWELLKRVTREGGAVISTQVLQEFYVTVTRKLERPLSPDHAERAVEHLTKLPVVLVDPGMILDAIRISKGHSISLWDALILRAAKEAGCQKVLTEDLQHLQRVESIQIENPFLT